MPKNTNLENQAFEKEYLIAQLSKTIDKVIFYEKNAINYIYIIIILVGTIGAITPILLNTLEKNIMYHIMIFTPIIINALVLIALLYAKRSMEVGGYQKYLEMRINNFLPQPYATWETVFCGKKIFKLSSTMIIILLGLVFLGLLSISILGLIFFSDTIYWFIVCTIEAIEITCFAILIREWAVSHEASYQKCLKYEDNKLKEKLDSSIKVEL